MIGDVFNLFVVGVVAIVVPDVVGACVDCEVSDNVFCGTLDDSAMLEVCCCMMFEVWVTGDVVCSDDDVIATGRTTSAVSIAD